VDDGKKNNNNLLGGEESSSHFPRKCDRVHSGRKDGASKEEATRLPGKDVFTEEERSRHKKEAKGRQKDCSHCQQTNHVPAVMELETARNHDREKKGGFNAPAR